MSKNNKTVKQTATPIGVIFLMFFVFWLIVKRLGHN